MTHYKCVLIAVDLNGNNDQLLHRARTMTSAATTHLVHVAEQPVTGYGDATGQNRSVNEMNVRQEAYPKLTALANDHGLAHENLHIVFGDLGQAVQQLAVALNADLIVTGSHGKHGLKRFLSSTSSKIQGGAKRDVLTIYTG